jgi:hypothetical protein
VSGAGRLLHFGDQCYGEVSTILNVCADVMWGTDGGTGSNELVSSMLDAEDALCLLSSDACRAIRGVDDSIFVEGEEEADGVAVLHTDGVGCGDC